MRLNLFLQMYLLFAVHVADIVKLIIACEITRLLNWPSRIQEKMISWTDVRTRILSALLWILFRYIVYLMKCRRSALIVQDFQGYKLAICCFTRSWQQMERLIWMFESKSFWNKSNNINQWKKEKLRCFSQKTEQIIKKVSFLINNIVV